MFYTKKSKEKMVAFWNDATFEPSYFAQNATVCSYLRYFDFFKTKYTSRRILSVFSISRSVPKQ